jgi:cation transport ATPase
VQRLNAHPVLGLLLRLTVAAAALSLSSMSIILNAAQLRDTRI